MKGVKQTRSPAEHFWMWCVVLCSALYHGITWKKWKYLAIGRVRGGELSHSIYILGVVFLGTLMSLSSVLICSIINANICWDSSPLGIFLFFEDSVVLVRKKTTGTMWVENRKQIYFCFLKGVCAFSAVPFLLCFAQCVLDVGNIYSFCKISRI